MTFFVRVYILLGFLIKLYIIKGIAYNIKLWFNAICFIIYNIFNNLLYLFLSPSLGLSLCGYYHLDHNYADSVLPQGLGNLVLCTGGSEGKGKRKASFEDDESANKRFKPEGGIAGVSTEDSDKIKKKLREVNEQMNETAQELSSVSKDLNDVRHTINIDDRLGEDQKHKNNAMQEMKKKYSSFFDEDSGNATDREGLDQVKDFLEQDLNGLSTRHKSLFSLSNKLKSKLFNSSDNDGKGGSGSASGFGGGTSSDSGSSGQGGSGDGGSSSNSTSYIDIILIYIFFFVDAISTNLDIIFSLYN